MDGHIERLDAQLKAIALAIEKMEKKTGDGSSSLLARLKTKYVAAREKLDALAQAGNENWGRYKTDIWIAWNELENALEDLHLDTLPNPPKYSSDKKFK